MGYTWEILGIYMGNTYEIHRKNMGNTQEIHGKYTANTQEKHRKYTGKTREIHGKYLGHTCKSNERIIANERPSRAGHIRQMTTFKNQKMVLVSYCAPPLTCTADTRVSN